jgi:hypothetical protein
MLLSLHQPIHKLQSHVKFVEVCRCAVVLNFLCSRKNSTFSFEMSILAEDEAVPAALPPPHFLTFYNTYGGSWIDQKIYFCINVFIFFFILVM